MILAVSFSYIWLLGEFSSIHSWLLLREYWHWQKCFVWIDEHFFSFFYPVNDIYIWSRFCMLDHPSILGIKPIGHIQSSKYVAKFGVFWVEDFCQHSYGYWLNFQRCLIWLCIRIMITLWVRKCLLLHYWILKKNYVASLNFTRIHYEAIWPWALLYDRFIVPECLY